MVFVLRRPDLQPNIRESNPVVQRDPNALCIYTFPVSLWPNAGHGLLILEVSKSHTTTQQSQ